MDNNPMEPLSIEQLQRSFNHAKDDVRLVSLLSPTCDECIEGHEVVRQMFSTFEFDDLKALNVWLPMLQGDNSNMATEQAGTFQNARILAEGWDEKCVIGKAYEKTLGLTRTAWDVYLVYKSGVTWEGELPPKPTFWMHQLTEDSGADQAFCLNPVVLASEIEKHCLSTMKTTEIKLESTITCPHCEHESKETMPTDACQFFWECPSCKTILRPKEEDCCVFCSFGDNPCPSIQVVGESSSSCCQT